MRAIHRMGRTLSSKLQDIGAVVMAFALGLVVGGVVPFQVSGWGWLLVIFATAVLILDVVTLLRGLLDPQCLTAANWTTTALAAGAAELFAKRGRQIVGEGARGGFGRPTCREDGVDFVRFHLPVRQHLHERAACELHTAVPQGH